MILIPFFTEALPDALDAFKNFQTAIPSTSNLNFWCTSIGSDFSKSETVTGHILQSADYTKINNFYIWIDISSKMFPPNCISAGVECIQLGFHDFFGGGWEKGTSFDFLKGAVFLQSFETKKGKKGSGSFMIIVTRKCTKKEKGVLFLKKHLGIL